MAQHSASRPSAADEAALLEALRDQVARLKDAPGFWRERLADVQPSDIGTRSDLAKLPVLRKSDLVALQEKKPPFGGLTPTPAGQLARLFVSPGPICDPEGRGEDWWGAARALHAAGVKEGDIALNTFSYHLTPAGAMFETGAHALGCAVIPAGPGNTADQLIAIARFRPSVYIGTPDFLKILLDKAASSGVDTGSLKRAVVSGAALPDTLRDHFKAHGIATVQCYGTADLGIVAYEDGGEGMAVNDGVVLEVVRPGTDEPLADGEVGEVVVTRLNRDYPLIRFATGDMSRMLDASADGRPRFAGWMGRADQATKVKGMFVRPEQIAALGKALGVTGRMRLEVSRAGEQDAMHLRIEHDDEGLADKATAALVDFTKLKGTVEIVPPGTLPNDGKVISDERG